MSAKAKKISKKISVKRMIEDIVGCKWSLTVIDLIKNNVNRPGAMEKKVEGLSTKVLNERLRKLVKYGVVLKTIFPEVPPRVEYSLTEFGIRFITILDAIENLEAEFSGK